MSRITPTIGRIVLYCLSAQDAEEINRRRTSPDSIAKRIFAEPPAWPVGAQAHIGNGVAVGDVYPAVIVRTWGDTPDAVVNLQVFLDGNDTFWATSRRCSEEPEPGEFHWMPYQKGQAARTDAAEAAAASALSAANFGAQESVAGAVAGSNPDLDEQRARTRSLHARAELEEAEARRISLLNGETERRIQSELVPGEPSEAIEAIERVAELLGVPCTLEAMEFRIAELQAERSPGSRTRADDAATEPSVGIEPQPVDAG